MEQRKTDRRAANFTKVEENLLLKIVNSHYVIENKKTDAVTNAMKAQEWVKIFEEFNSQNIEQQRDAATLRRKYENIKRSIKKKLSEEKSNLTKTGGGPEEKVIFDSEETQLLQVIGSQATGFENTYGDDDDDVGVTQDNQNTKSVFLEFDGAEQYVDDEPGTSTSYIVMETKAMKQCCDSGEPEVGKTTTQPNTNKQPRTTHNFDPTQPSSLAQPKHPALRVRKRDRPLDKVSAWAKSKAEIAQDEQTFRCELHEQKMRHWEEEHELRKKLLQQQLRHAEERHSWLRDEHEEKMKITK